MSTRFDRNHGFEQELERDPRMVTFIRTTTTEVSVSVRASAPDETGYYKRRVRPNGNRVEARDVFWHLIEFGSAKNVPYAPLRRGVRAAGLRLDDTDRP